MIRRVRQKRKEIVESFPFYDVYVVGREVPVNEYFQRFGLCISTPISDAVSWRFMGSTAGHLVLYPTPHWNVWEKLTTDKARRVFSETETFLHLPGGAFPVCDGCPNKTLRLAGLCHPGEALCHASVPIPKLSKPTRCRSR